VTWLEPFQACAQRNQEYTYSSSRASWHVEMLSAQTFQHTPLFHLAQHFPVMLKQ